MPNASHQNEFSSTDKDMPAVAPIEQGALLEALDNTTIHYYRYFPQEKKLVLPEATARQWQCEMVYENVPENEEAFSYLADEDKPAFVEAFNKIAAGSPCEVAEFRLDEFERWCRVTITVVSRDDNNVPLEAIAVIEDRSEDMAREELIRQRNETLSYLAEVFQMATRATDATVVVYDYDADTTTSPEDAASEWGIPAEHHNGPHEIAESGIVLPESKEAYLAIHEKMRNGADEAHAKIQLRTPAGKIETHELVFRALKDADGKPLRKAVGIFNNISEFEEKTQHQAAMSRALARGINAAFFVDLDNDTFALEQVVSEYMSDTIHRFVDENAHSGSYTEIVRLYCEKLVCEEDRARMLDELSIERVLENLAKSNSYYLQYRMADNPEGQEYFEMHIVATDHIPGNNAFISFRCIDDQKSRELQHQQALKDAFLAAQQANKAKSEFFSRMSHDIRTPMNAIVGMTALANSHIDDKDRVQDCLAKITLSSQHLLGLINDVLDMSKIESGMVDLNVEEFDLAKLVENLITMSRHLIEGHNHELVVNVHDINHEKVVGDPQRIQQAFMNLMSNAAKYTMPGGVIRLSITEKPVAKDNTGCYEFVFEDSGIGMSPDFIEHIFEPFTRAEDSRMNAEPGTGLGMSITNNIVQMMNGSIEVESELGRGSKFIVTIYLELQDVNEELSVDHLKGKSVLIADDDRITCESATSMLCDLGMQAEWVLSGKEAVQRIEERYNAGDDYFAVIVDWKMPDMDGLDTTRAIRQAVGDSVPIIIASAFDWSEIEVPARGAGANTFISKPLFRSRVLHQFKLILDEEMDVRPAPINAIDALVQADYSGKRVLLVEDNMLNREIATEFLEMAGLEIEVAENGKQAVDMLAACEDGHYDMVFMDIQMPIMNGYDATRAVRSSSRNYLKSIPIVAMTADAFAEDVHAAQLAGMNGHLAKPIDLDKLTSILNRWLGN